MDVKKEKPCNIETNKFAGCRTFTNPPGHGKSK